MYFYLFSIGSQNSLIFQYFRTQRVTHSVFIFRMARRDMIASVTAFLNCLIKRTIICMSKQNDQMLVLTSGGAHTTETHSPHREIHGPNGKQRKCVHFNHDGHKCHIQNHLDKSCKTDIKSLCILSTVRPFLLSACMVFL